VFPHSGHSRVGTSDAAYIPSRRTLNCENGKVAPFKLDFDSPLPPDVPEYPLAIDGEQAVSQELGRMAEGSLEMLEKNLDKWRGAFAKVREPNVVQTYARCLPLIQRFLTAELDTVTPTKRGIGRTSDAEPPPRLGAKYRKQLTPPDARVRVGEIMERVILGGFAARVAINENLVENPIPFVERDLHDIWGDWIFSFFSAWQDTDLSKADPEHLEMLWTMVVATKPLDDFVRTAEKLKIVKRGPFKGIRNYRALTLMQYYIGTGRALWWANTDSARRAEGEHSA
jgi:hypothetical protein